MKCLVTVASALILSMSVASNMSHAATFPWAGTCTAESPKPDADGAAAEAVALKYIGALTVGDVTTIRAITTADTNSKTQDVELSNLVRYVASLGVRGDTKLIKAFVLKMSITPKDVVMVPCSNPNSTRGMDVVAVGAVKKQYHAIYTVAMKGEGELTYSIWLQFIDDQWKVAGFHADPDLMGGRDAFAWWNAAKKQRSEGHNLIADLLYYTAINLLSRGPAYQPAGLSDLRQDVSTFRAPAELAGPTPLTWALDGKIFKIANVGPVGVPEGKVVLSLTQLVDWSDDDDAARKNHELIEAFIKIHPEWTESFDYVAARSCKPSVHPEVAPCFGTLYDKTTGYAK